MENNIDVLKNENVSLVEEVKDVKPLFNPNASENIIRLCIRCKKRKSSKGIEFNTAQVSIYLDCYDEDGNFEEKANRWVDLKFKREAFKEAVGETINVSSIDDLSGGFLYVKGGYIDKPKRYQIKDKVDKNGNTIYDENGEALKQFPECWIKGGIIGFEKYVPSQDDFEYHKKENVIDAETGEIK